MTREVLLTGVGMLNHLGLGIDAVWQAVCSWQRPRPLTEYYLPEGAAARQLKDRRLLKAISPIDALGLVALEDLKSHLKFSAGCYEPERVGMYAGAVPSTFTAHEPYLPAIQLVQDEHGEVDVAAFGSSLERSRPTTLLASLINNVLCYGSIMFDARGPNSNYTSICLAAHHALINGAKRVQRGQLAMAIVGAYTSRAHPSDRGALAQHGLVRGQLAQGDNDGLIMNDQAVFLALEAEAAEGRRPFAKYLGGAIRSDGRTALARDLEGKGLYLAIEAALASAGVTAHEIGAVFACQSGLKAVDAVEISVLQACFAEVPKRPVLLSSFAVMGSGMEAGGLAEMALWPLLRRHGEVPRGLRLATGDFGWEQNLQGAKPLALVVRTSPFGEYSAVVIEGLS